MMESIQSLNSCRNQEILFRYKPKYDNTTSKISFSPWEVLITIFVFPYQESKKNGKNKYNHDRPTLKHITAINITMMKIKNHPNICL